ncbi:MAG: NUDIX domain-containing protein [Rhodospirillales bacterium]
MASDKPVNDGDAPSGIEIDERDRVFDGYFKVERLTLRHELYQGGWSAPLVREVLSRGHAVAVLPYDPLRGEIVLVEQFRVAALKAFDEPGAQVGPEQSPNGAWLLECIAGIVEDGEAAVEAAVREAIEEAGCVVDDLIHARSFLTSPGCLTESVSFFCGRTDASGVGGVHGVDHEGEDIRVVKMSPQAAFDLMDSGGINNAFTLIALEWLRGNIAELDRRWS